MKIISIHFREFQQLIQYYSKFNPSPMSIKKFIDFGKTRNEKKSFLFLKKELPVRLANIMQELSLLPECLLKMSSVNLVQSWYKKSFQEILEFESIDSPQDKDLKKFCDSLVRIRNRHSNVVQTMAEGVIELKETHSIQAQMDYSIQYFLHRFYMCRISIRMLINQHTSLFGIDNPSHPRYIGCVDPNCEVNPILINAFENAKSICYYHYFMSPELIIEHHNEPNKKGPISIVYVPSHLYHILFELFKNAMRAVVETYGESENIPPIKVLLIKGQEDLTIKISDQGGGIKRSLIGYLFNYLYSTAPKPFLSNSQITPLAGYGYGLPVSRLYARYFQGDLILNSFENYGTDAIVYLKVLSSEANEMLPIFNKTSSKHYRSHLGTHDWSNSLYSTS